MKLNSVYVTVGTTRFVALFEEIISDRTLKVLKNLGCRMLILQIGTSSIKLDSEGIYGTYGIQVEQYDFKFESVRTDIINSDLVIGHAGAGTCMDILAYEKPGLIVTNNELMGNHQLELALQLADEGYIYYCDINQISKCLDTLDFGALKCYNREPKSGMEKFISYLNNMMVS